jgi:serine/threonine protein kinase
MAGLEGEDPPIVHRDLKPSNVFVDGAGTARVADMNLSLRLNEDTLALLTGETGTYLYMSPEMMRHEVCLHVSDMFTVDTPFCACPSYGWAASSLPPFSSSLCTLCAAVNCNLQPGTLYSAKKPMIVGWHHRKPSHASGVWHCANKSRSL